MKTIFYTLLLIGFAFVSCDKDSGNKYIRAGKYDSDFFYHEYSPPLKVTLSLDSISYYLTGTDSIDLNLDGIFDIVIEQSIETENSIAKVGNEYYYSFCKLFFKDGIEIATETQIFGASHGENKPVVWIDTLNYDDKIDKYLDWSGSGSFENMWLIAPDGQVYPKGYWFDVIEEEMFVGIRMKNNSSTKFGWIRINGTSHKNMQFINYAIEK